MVARGTVKYRSFQKKFWNELLGITVKPKLNISKSRYLNILSRVGNTVGTFRQASGQAQGSAVETRYRDA